MDNDTTSRSNGGPGGEMEVGGQITDGGYESDVQVSLHSCAKFCSSIFRSAALRQHDEEGEGARG